jgi:hypothetical protein
MKFYRIVLIVGLVLTTLPYLILLKDVEWDIFPISQELFWSNAALLVGGVCGLVGITFLLWQIILGVRNIAQLFSDDLAWIKQVHIFIGTYGILIVFIHIFFSMYGYARDLLWIFLPANSSVFEVNVTYGRLAFCSLLIIWISSAFLREKVKYRPWLYIHYISYAIIFAYLAAWNFP